MPATAPQARLVITTLASAWLLLVANLAVGLLLESKYRPTMDGAYRSVATMHEGALWRFLAGFHYWASGIALLVGILAMGLALWNGWHRWEARWVWWSTLATFALSMGLQITGNILPLSSHDARTANIEGGVVAAVPVLGQPIRELLMGGEALSQTGLSNLHLLHIWVLPGLLLAAIIATAIVLRQRSAGQPYWPLAFFLLLLVCLLGASPGAPLGSAATAADLASTGALPMWYVVPLHALRVVFVRVGPTHEWLGTALVPGLLFAWLVCLPFINRKASGPSFTARVSLLGAAVGLVLVCASAGGGVQSPFDEPHMIETPPRGEFPPVNPVMAAKGREVVLAQGCLRCHHIGSEGKGNFGPNLKRVGSRHSDPRWFMDMVRNPASKGRPGMPPFADLKGDDLRSLAEYLRSLK